MFLLHFSFFLKKMILQNGQEKEKLLKLKNYFKKF